MNCPQCGLEHDDEVVTCVCGYDAVEISRLEVQLQKEKKVRNTGVVLVAAGLWLMLTGIGAMVSAGGALAFIMAPLFILLKSRNVRQARNQLRAAKTPKQLPEARIV